MQARSIWCRVAVSDRAGKELWFVQFKLVQTRSIVPCSLGSCRQGALVLPFMLVQTRSIVPCSLGSCRRGALCLAV
ncbi:hypothetical protein ACFX2F_027699 [Malus domestica]